MKTSGDVGINAWGSEIGLVNDLGLGGEEKNKSALSAFTPWYMLFSELVVNVRERQARVLSCTSMT